MAQAIRSRLGPLISRTRSTVEPAYRWTEGMASKHYEQLMKENQQYVVKDKAAADKLLRQYVFTSLARIPDGLKQNSQEAGQLRGKLSGITHMPLTEVGMYALFVGEVYAWFCVGEVVGRGFTLGGYDI